MNIVGKKTGTGAKASIRAEGAGVEEANANVEGEVSSISAQADLAGPSNLIYI